MKNTIIASLALAAASSLSAQEFVAGWDFDNVGAADTSAFANWGDQKTSALLSWTHTPSNPPIVFTSEFGFDGSFSDVSANDTFAFADPDTTFTAFSQGPANPTAENGFQSVSAGDSFTLNFDGSLYQGLELTYAVSLTGEAADYQKVTVDLSGLEGSGAATFVINTDQGALYDNFALTATNVVPEPSTYAAIAGALALGFVAYRRRK